MKILKIEAGKSKFLINSKEVSPEELNRDDLLKLLNDIYEMTDQTILKIPTSEEMEEIKNPVEKEIVNQIIKKISDFSSNVINIKDEVNMGFPEIQ